MQFNRVSAQLCSSDDDRIRWYSEREKRKRGRGRKMREGEFHLECDETEIGLSGQPHDNKATACQLRINDGELRFDNLDQSHSQIQCDDSALWA